MGIAIDELTDEADVMLLVETWEHDTQRINGLGKYNVHSLMWTQNAKQRRGQGGVACLIKKGLEDYVSIVKDDKHKKYTWLKISTPNCMSTFVAGCYIPHHNSSFYTCIDKYQPFVDFEEGIVHFKDKGEVIILGDMNAHTRTL